MERQGKAQGGAVGSELTAEMGNAAEVLSRRKVVLAAALYLCNVVLLPQALYNVRICAT